MAMWSNLLRDFVLILFLPPCLFFYFLIFWIFFWKCILTSWGVVLDGKKRQAGVCAKMSWKAGKGGRWMGFSERYGFESRGYLCCGGL